MRNFDESYKNTLYLLYRLLSPVLDPIKLLHGIVGYFWFIRDIRLFNAKAKKANGHGLASFKNLYPQLHDKTVETKLDAHYFYQQLWLFENVLKNRPTVHVDISSTYQMSGYLSKIVKTIFCDIRPINTKLSNLEVRNENITKLTFADNSVESVSSLHVIEHIGLGRYGDAIEPEGSKLAAAELARILAPGGFLYISCPIGIECVYFNAHRVFDPHTILEYFAPLELVSFSAVDDTGDYVEHANITSFATTNYGCGMFKFRKKDSL